MYSLTKDDFPYEVNLFELETNQIQFLLEGEFSGNLMINLT
ncbi:MAG: hypothetical protein Q3980_02155 [Turicibacter sp.]|nr:hypothetical protein [Turicibacter sp.]